MELHRDDVGGRIVLIEFTTKFVIEAEPGFLHNALEFPLHLIDGRFRRGAVELKRQHDLRPGGHNRSVSCATEATREEDACENGAHISQSRSAFRADPATSS